MKKPSARAAWRTARIGTVGRWAVVPVMVVVLGAGPVVMAQAVPGEMPGSTGAVQVDGRSYPAGTGCVTVRRMPSRLRVITSGTVRARVYLLPGCRGGLTKSVDSGSAATPIGASVFVG